MMDLPISTTATTLSEVNANFEGLLIFKVSNPFPKVQVLNSLEQYLQGTTSAAKSSLIHRLTY